MKRKAQVIVMGAGATRGALGSRIPPPPLDADFFDIASQISGRGTRRLSARVANDVYSLYDKVSGIGLEQYFRDIEARAEIGQFAKTKNKPKDWERRKRDLEELIRRVLIETTHDLDEKGGEAKDHKTILRKLRSGDTLITFNYDTVLEEAMPKLGCIWDPRDGYGFEASGVTLDWARNWRKNRDNAGEASEATLLKLHGSLNWTLYKTNKVRLKPRPYVVRARRGAPVFDQCAILPPGWHKRVDRNPYKELWRQARLAMESCFSLAIVGYSLPDTDLLARALLAEVTRTRAARRNFLEHLHIADPSAVVKDRFVSLFAPALHSKGRVYRYQGLHEFAEAWSM